ncbi:MAG: peptidoglycan DD-metalloendopeptidase family protein, partial [Caldisericaceae bacterium]|nr:peptidoglycan DD-metalloendopeptidase family protein [Caldisericaceae bacterium]
FYSYKYGRVKNIELLISARSINQALVRIKYLQQIARHDANLIKIIENKRQQIAAIKRTLQSNLQQKNLALREIQKKTNQYLARKAEKQNLLRKLKSTHYSYQKQLTEKDRQRKQLLDLIAALEKERLAKAKQTVPAKSTEISFNFENFRKAKGKLPWPVKGKVITRYGKQRDPVSKTYIKNTDIEIKARPGTPVKCIFPGVVRIITFLPGYGNTVIVDHGKGFYSIYSHLAQIYVYKNATVRQNQIIGKVGDSGYLGPVSLRFGIYGSKKTYNPLSWLE